jgi:nucleoside 2-deoxyribosyltransferase
MSQRIYLAGPEVFLRDPESIFEAKRAICRRYGFKGVSPLETHLESDGRPRSEVGWMISRANEQCMRSCDLLIANLTPFRSPSADPGTAFELGFMRALGRPVLGYTNVDSTLVARMTTYCGGKLPRRGGNGELEDLDGLLVENFGLVDNLMLQGAVVSSGFHLEVVAAAPDKRFTDLLGFQRCVQQAADALQREDPAHPQEAFST